MGRFDYLKGQIPNELITAMENEILVPDTEEDLLDRVAASLRTATTTVDVATAAAPLTGQVLTAINASSARWETPGGGGSSDHKVSVDSSDTTSDYLDGKLVTANGLAKTVIGVGAEQLQLSPTYGSSANTVCQGNDARLSDARAPLGHNSSHKHLGSDEIATATPGANLIPKADGSGTLNAWVTAATPSAHKTSHENGGSDQLSVAGLLGELATAQTPKSHSTSHKNGGTDEIATITPAAGAIPKADGSGTLNSWVTSAVPTSHNSSHKHLGSDEIASATPGANLIPKADGSGTLNAWVSGVTPAAHKTSHQNGGSDQLSVAGLTGELATAQTPKTHSSSHTHGGTDELSTATPTANAIPKADAFGTLNSWVTAGTPALHKTTHQNGGSDQISLAGLTGEAATPQVPKSHNSSHTHGGTDEIASATAGANLIPKADGSGTLNSWITAATPTAHATSHKYGGSDVIGTTTPTINAIPIADGAGTLNSWITAAIPITHNSTHKNGGTDEIASLSPGAFLIPKADAAGKLDSWVSGYSVTTAEFHAYVDSSRPDDSGDGLSWLTAKKTIPAGLSVIPDIIKHNTCLHLKGTFTDFGTVIIQRSVSTSTAKFIIDGGSEVTVVSDNSGANYTATTPFNGSSINDSTASWTVDQYTGYWVEIVQGTGNGQTRLIHANSATTITPTVNWTTSPDGTSKFRIVRPTTEINGTSTFTDFQLQCEVVIQNLYFSGTNSRLLVVSCPSFTTISGVICASTYTFPIQAAYSTSLTFSNNIYNSTTFDFDTNKKVSSSIVGTGHVYCYALNNLRFDGVVFKQTTLESISRISFYYGIRIRTAPFTIEGCPFVFVTNATGYATHLIGSNSSGTGLSLVNSYMRLFSNLIVSENLIGIKLVFSQINVLGNVLVSGINTNWGVLLNSQSNIRMKSGYTWTVTGGDGDFTFDNIIEYANWSDVTLGNNAVSSAELSMVSMTA